MNKRYAVYLIDNYETMAMRELLRDNFNTEAEADAWAAAYVTGSKMRVRVVVVGYFGN